uniref:Uncharacterized protein n=1 Tax=viral metagenome TaxID=1070528 RepID=A0A6C0I3K6_9ZZZZ
MLLSPYLELFSAIEDGNVDRVKDILATSNIDVNYYAVDSDDPDYDFRECSVITLAFIKRNLEIVEIFLKYGSEKGAKISFLSLLDPMDSIHIDFPKIKLLLDYGANVNEILQKGRTILHMVCYTTWYINYQPVTDILKLLLKHGADVNILDDAKRSPLWYICSGVFSTIEDIRLFIDAGANVNAKDYAGTTPFYEACRKSSYTHFNGFEKILLLVDNGADVYIKDVDNMAPLHYSCMHGHMCIIKFLLYKNVEIDGKTDEGETPLSIVCSNLNNYNEDAIDLIKKLLELGANVDNQTNTGATPLMVVCAQDESPMRLEVAKLLLDNGADVSLIVETEEESFTALKIAEKNNDRDMIDLLLNNEQYNFREASSAQQEGGRRGRRLKTACKGRNRRMCKTAKKGCKWASGPKRSFCRRK